MDSELKQRWLKFLDGHWQKDQPLAEGVFPVADYKGNFSPSSYIVVFQHPTNKRYLPVHPWSGFWWSEPYPDLPKPLIVEK